MKHTKLEGDSLQGMLRAGHVLDSHPVAPSRIVRILDQLLARTVAGQGCGLLGSGSSLVGSSILVTILSRLDLSSVLLVLVDSPVEDIVVLETLTNEQITEDLTQVAVVGLVIETQGAGVIQVDGELVGEAAAQNLGRGCHLLFHDTVILLLLGRSLQTLPRQRATAEVKHNVTKRLHVITSGLLCIMVSNGTK